MAHARQKIREQVAATLTGLSTTGSNVTASRVRTLPASVTRHLSVYTLEDDVDEAARVFGTKEFRDMTLVLEGRVKASSGWDDALDDIDAETSAALYADQTLGGLVKTLGWLGCDIDVEDGSDQPVGVIRIRYSVLYRVDAASPTTVID